MELSFNVAWGPLSQIAIPLIDVHSAVQLAIGAYGWWKARERTSSLLDMIRAYGGRLVASSAFDPSRYKAARQGTVVRGIAWFDGRLESVPLPHASTGTSGDSGTLCLRAITTALLAVYNATSTSAVLTRIITDCLINYDLDGERLAAAGWFQQTVQEYVDSVSAEEQCNT